jgi:translation initiation factor 1
MSKIKPIKSSDHIVYSTHPIEEEIDQEVSSPANVNKPTGLIKIYTEKRSGGKTVTLKKNLPGNGCELEDLLKTLKKNCAAGGTIKERVMELQGDQKKRAGHELDKLGYKVKIYQTNKK